jgi:diguanylate cyclase (GGDEF)-like protein/PAS domain S-box-containing protein
MRFYAGVPLAVESGVKIGALCIGDTRPRAFEKEDAERLKQFAHVVEGLIETYWQSARARRIAGEAADQANLLWRQNRMLRQVERIGKIGGWELDLASNIVEWTEEVARIHGVPVGEPCPLDDALAFYPEAYRTMVRNNLDRSIATGDPYDFEAEFVTSSGEKKWVRAAGEAEFQDGKATRVFGMFQDITAEKAASERLWHAANYDELTKLANRHHFNRHLGETIERAQAGGKSVALMVIDLDNFKQVNDKRGHAVGDFILAQVAARLQHALPEDCLVARLGGDEFAVVVPGDAVGRAQRKAKQILSAVREPIQIGRTRVSINASLGISVYPSDATDASDLLKRADLALYSAKQSGRGMARTYSAPLATLFERHADAVDLVRGALTARRLVPFYQPKVSLNDGHRFGFEALARIITPTGMVLTPDRFAPALDDAETGRLIGRRMLHTVTADLVRWRRAGLEPGSVSINVSEADFADGKLAEHILGRLERLGLPPSSITIEVTETVFLGEEAPLVSAALSRLDAAGVMVELDDFGTGYASLSHLRAFPIRRLKIDRTFIRDLVGDADTRAIVRAVVDLGHNLSCEIIAEGVETSAQSAMLRSMGCDSVQGYFYGLPSSEKATEDLLRTEARERGIQLSELARRYRPEGKPRQQARRAAGGKAAS